MIRIPVTLALRPGWEHVPDSYVSPVVSIGISAMPVASADGTVTRNPPHNALALVDTGADTIWADKKFLVQIGAQKIGPSKAVTRTAQGDQVLDEYAVFLHIPGMKPLPMRVAALPFDGDTRAYQVIMGMMFIKSGRLVIDPQNESFLDLPENFGR
ncbi:hypothetical protein CCO03_17040 [Comamonas serinivorans]|uniref:Peptidase A2 domain-containing protein n=1 Tax=Comamonas serinivorans TaxID=1082851 RepID=A0A1Y0ESC9_9BURK|nr:hypothetical protein [Comamonas serinivorans]ARU06152.1 hypothetical protein CCO03_17040 [Comamonas serinivorans]